MVGQHETTDTVDSLIRLRLPGQSHLKHTHRNGMYAVDHTSTGNGVLVKRKEVKILTKGPSEFLLPHQRELGQKREVGPPCSDFG